MLKRLAKCVREYKTMVALTLIFIIAEAIIETAIPFVTVGLINDIGQGVGVDKIWPKGLLLVGMALISLTCGGVAAFTCSKASAGFAKNLRHDVYAKVQEFDFSNIDKFSSSSLVTRMTTDVANVQMSFMMLIRTAIRCPLMLIFSVVMAYVMGGFLSTAFVVVIPVLAVGLFIIGKKAMPAFR